MNYVIISIGLFMAVMSVAFVTEPALMRKIMAFMRVGVRCYIGGVVRIILGGLLLYASREASFFWVPLVVGILMVISGALMFVLGLARVHAYLDWWAAKSDTALRAVPAFGGLIGVLLVYSA